MTYFSLQNHFVNYILARHGCDEDSGDFRVSPQRKYNELLVQSPLKFGFFIFFFHFVVFIERLFGFRFAPDSWLSYRFQGLWRSLRKPIELAKVQQAALAKYAPQPFVFLDPIITYSSDSIIDMEQVMERGVAAKALMVQDKVLINKKHKYEGIKDCIPAGKDMYVFRQKMFDMLMRRKRSKEVDITRIEGSEIIEMKHMDVGTLTPGENVVLNVKLVDDDSILNSKASDYTLHHSARESKYATAMHVGAIEVIFDSFASPSSDIVGGVVLVDTAHKTVENAVRSVFVTGLAGGKMIRVLMYPNTLVEIGPKMNERFKLVCSTSNSDIADGFNLAAVKVNVVGCTQSLTARYVPQPFLDQCLNEERGTVVEYLGQMSYVMHNSNEISEEFLAQQTMAFDLGSNLRLQGSSSGASLQRSTSMRYLVGPRQSFKQLEPDKEPSAFERKRLEAKDGADKFRDSTFVDPVYGKTRRAFGQTSMTRSLLNRFSSANETEGTPLDTKIARTKILLTKVMAGGKILYTARLSDVLLNKDQRAAISFQRTHVQHRKLVALATLGVPENTGCALMMCYNSGVRGKAVVDAYTASAEASVIWNPACQRQAMLEIDVNPCQSGWSYQYLRQTNSYFNVVCISGWTTTPLTDLSMTIDWYLSSEESVTSIYYASGGNPKIKLNRWMGRLIFPQGTETTMQRMPLAIGGGAGGNGLVYMNMPNALCSLWRYMRGGVKFEVIKLSSPYVKATIAFFIAFTDVDATLPNLEAYPHKLVQFAEIQDRVTIEFDKDEFVMAWSSQVHTNVPLDQDGCPYLYAVVHDCAGSTIPGDFNIGVVLKEMVDVEAIGRHPGWKGARPLPASPQGLRKSPSGVWNELYTIRGPPEAKSTEVVQFAIDLIGVGISTAGRGIWSLETSNSPMNNLLRTATWKSGTLHFQVLMEGNPLIKRGDWASYCEISLVQSAKDTTLSSRNWVMKDPSSWELEFDIKVEGPNAGFENWETHLSNQTSWYLTFAVYNPDQTTVFVVNGMLNDDFCCAGNTLMPPFLEPQSLASDRTPLSQMTFSYEDDLVRSVDPPDPANTQERTETSSDQERRLQQQRRRGFNNKFAF
uniref:RNA2 polyprotein n=1 Tax=Radish mosaic virus TaxID=328061 RepID=B6ZKN5_9SECO|nr:RNA2-polyprotein [Radish mosaic virus]